ncbi:MAG: hypothetical protein AB8F95_03915 [Bacteroidia bacterium]
MKHLLPYILAFICLGFAAPQLQAQGNAGSAPSGIQPKNIPTSQAKAAVIAEVKKKEQEIEVLVDQYKEAVPENRSIIRNDLESALRELFELKLLQREQALRDLEDEIEEVQRSLEENRRNKDAIVRKRLAQLLAKRR